MTPESALTRPHVNYRWLLWPVALLVFVADQATKLLVARELALWESWRPFDQFPLSIFAITHISNTGAAFGILPDAGLFFVVVAIVVSGAIAYYYRRLPSDQWWLFLSLGLQLGGALGNLVDRLRLGYVVDFIEVGIWPIFNVADSSIVVGVVLLAWHFWREEQKAPAESAAVAPPVAELQVARSAVSEPPVRPPTPGGNGHRHLEPEEARQLIYGDGHQGTSSTRIEPPHEQ